MEELKDYFDPVEQGLQTKFSRRKGFIGQSIKFSSTIKNNKVALIGIQETRNAIGASYDCNPNKIREWLYQLATVGNLSLVDLGNLKNGKKVVDTYFSLQFVVQSLISKKVIPILFGGSHDLVMGAVKGIETASKECNVAIIDARADFFTKDEVHSQSYFHEILKNNIKATELSLIAYQSYFVSKQQLEGLNKLNIDLVRLGNIRSNINDVEPVLRDANLVSFDMSAIRYPDFEASEYLGPNGLYAEEACQLANISGLSDTLQAFILSEYNAEYDGKQQSAHLVAQIIWHVLYGIGQREGDYPATSLDNYKKIYVNLDRPDTELVFYKNETNHRYWIEIPIDNSGGVKILSCSEKDYFAICNNELPERIWRKITHYLK